jgi:sugar phosphate isomerase/epimerase
MLKTLPVQQQPLLLTGCSLPFADTVRYADVFLENSLRPEFLLTPEQALEPTPRLMTAALELVKTVGGCTVHAPFSGLLWHCQAPASEKNASLVLKATIEIAAQLEATNMVIHTNWDPRQEENLDRWLRRNVGIMADVTNYAISKNVRPVIENLREDAPQKLLKIVNLLHPDTGICIDPGHAGIISETKLEQWFCLTADKLAEIHIHNNFGGSDQHLPPDEGNVWDARATLQGLIEEKRTFIPVIEPANREGAVKSLEALKKWNLI